MYTCWAGDRSWKKELMPRSRVGQAFKLRRFCCTAHLISMSENSKCPSIHSNPVRQAHAITWPRHKHASAAMRGTVGPERNSTQRNVTAVRPCKYLNKNSLLPYEANLDRAVTEESDKTYRYVLSIWESSVGTGCLAHGSRTVLQD